VGETLAETRREVTAQRAELEETAARLRERVRRALDVRAKVRENPLLFGGLAVGGVFLAVGGPLRLFRAARQTLADELQRWRQDPRDRKAARKLAQEIAEGPPGPSRTAWRALEAAATLISAALARRAIERFLSGDQPLDAAAELAPAHPGPGGQPRPASTNEYSGWSARGDGGR